MTVQEHPLSWLRPDVPYSPLVQVGLLSCLRGRDDEATLHWRADGSGFGLECVLQTRLSLAEVAASIVAAPWPDLEQLPWHAGYGQAIKPVLKNEPDQVAAWLQLTGGAQTASMLEAVVDPRQAAERHVAALLTDGVLDADGALGRSRLMRGVKADLSGIKPARLDSEKLAAELERGPQWVATGAGSGLGLVPEVQTFGGVTGPKPDSVNASSPLVYALLVHAIGALAPFAAVRGSRRVVGGPLTGEAGTLTWAIHTTPRGLRALVALYGSVPSTDQFNVAGLPPGVAAVYRSRPRAINSMISMFSWGELIS